jgi:hypothetical protein
MRSTCNRLASSKGSIAPVSNRHATHHRTIPAVVSGRALLRLTLLNLIICIVRLQ